MRFFRSHLKHSDTNIFLSFWNMMSDALYYSNPITDKSNTNNFHVYLGTQCFVLKSGSLSDWVFRRILTSL